MEYKRQQGLVLVFLVFVAISYAEYVPSVKQASLNYPYNDTILPCTTQYYSYNNINGGAQTYLKATYQEWSNTGQTVNFALYYQTYDDAPIVSNSCQSPCNLTFYCGFQSGSYYLSLTTPSTSNTQNMSFAVGLYSYNVNVNSQNVPFTYNAINSQQQGGDDPMTVDHYQINVGTVSVHSELVVAVTGISGGNSLALCLNDGVLSNGPNGGCCPMSNTSVNGQDFQILVGSCMLQSDSTFYASVQVPSGNIANYTISASINPTPINSISLPYKGTGVLNPNDIIYYGFNFNGQQDEELLVTLTGIYGGSAEIFVNATNLPGPKSCTGASYKSCISDDVCTFTVQPCAFAEGAWYVAVTGTTFSKQQIQYAVELSTQSIAPTIVSLGSVDRAVYTDNIGEDQYDHYRLTINSNLLQDDTVLYVYLYVNFDKAPLTLFMNYASAAGLGECYQNLMNCSTSGDNPSEPTTCHFTLQRCNLTTGDYYFSVYGDESDTYGTGVAYTLSFQLANSVALQNATSISQTVWAAEYSHYHIDLAQSAYLPGQKLHVRISDVSNGDVVAYLNHNELAGDCPCYTWISYCNQTGPELDCTLDVTYCAFTYGSWYIGVYGENPMDSTQPIGFTIAAFIDAPPLVTSIGLNSTTNGLIAQVDSNFFMFTAPQTTSQELVVDLVITHHSGDDANAQLNLYMQTQNLADPTCYQYTCSASKSSNSYCTIVFDPCIFVSGDWSITITGVGNDTSSETHYTLTVTTRDVTPVQLQNGVSVPSQVFNEQYNEYYFSTSGVQSYPTVVVDVYVSQNVNPLTVFTNLNSAAGGDPCYGNNGMVTTNTSVQFVYPTCLVPSNSNFYFGLYGGDALFYQQPIQYTITANVQYPSLLDGTGYPVTGHVTPGNINHYYLSVQDNPLGQVLQVSVHNIKGGTLTTFFNFAEPAGSCPCYQSQYSFEGEFDYTNYFCNFQAGNYYIGVQGESATSAYVPVSYVLKAQYVQQPTGSLSLNTALSGVVSYNVLNTYKLNLGSVPSSSSLQVTLSNLISNGDSTGALNLYVSNGQPGSPSCNNAFTCTASTGSNQGCTVQLNSCAFSPSGNWYVTVYGALQNKTANVNFTLNANISSPTSVPMSQPYNDQIGAGSSKFYYLTSGVNLNNNQVFQIFLYNLSQSAPLTLYVNPSSPAGTGCYSFVYNCSTSFTDSCVITIPPCSISGGSTYYFTVSSPTTAVSYTVAANITTIASTNSLPLNQQASYSSLLPNTYVTYTIQVGNVAAQSALLITTQIQQGSLSVFTSFGSIPLNAPCYQNLCEGTSGQTCEFYVPACCLQSGTYYTTVYNRYGNSLSGSFQISNTLYPGNNTISLSFGSNNTINTGVAQNQAQFYSTSVSIQQYSSVLLSISATGSSLDTYVQKNTVAGNSGCYSSWFQCQRQVSNNNPCVVQVPPCAVNNGDLWYITLNNTGSTSNPGYSVATQEQRIRSLSIGAPYNDSVISNTYNHYEFSWNGPSGLSTFTTSQLNFTLNVYNNAQASMYINFGAPAGIEPMTYQYSHYQGGPNSPITQLNCLTSMYTCQASAATNYQCVVTIPTCQTAKGTYFVSVFGSSQTSNSNYSVAIAQQQAGNVGTLQTNVPTTYNGNQLLTLNTGTPQNNQYLILNVTNVSSSGASVTVTLWPSCECFTQALQCIATSNSPCQIFFDPCTFVGGTYNLNITTNGAYNYTLSANIQGSVNPLQTLQLDTPYSDVLGPYQYQFYTIDTGLTDGTESVTFTVNANCGKVDFFLSTSAPASAACNEYNCIGQSSCTFTIPSCDYFGGKFFLTTHIADPTYMTFHDQIWVPVVYDVTVTKSGWNITDVMTHDTVVMSTNQQLRVHVDALSIGTQLYFWAQSSSQEITLYVSKNMIIGGEGCEDALNITCQQNEECIIPIDPCTFTPGYYYVTVNGYNVTVTSYYESKYIPIITDGNFTGSVASGQYQYYRIPVDTTQDGLQFNVQVNNISGGSVQVFLVEDDFGRVAASGCSMYSCAATTEQCEIEIDGCGVGNNYYLGVYGSNLAGCVITYTLTVTQTVELQILPVNTLVCGTVAPGTTTYYQLSVPQGTSLFASYLTVTLSDATEPVEVNWYNDFVPGSTCSAASCNGTNCNFVVCHPTSVYIAVTSLSTSISNYQIEANLITPNVVAINAGTNYYTGSGTTYYSYTSSTYAPVIATANFNGQLYVDNGFLAVEQCAPFSCTSSSTCSINTLCEGDNSGETFYFTVNAVGSFSFNVQSPVSQTTPLTTSPVNGNAGPEVSYYSYKNQVTGAAALDFVFTSIYGGSISVYASLGTYPTPECAEYNTTISQAEQTGFLSIPACQLVYGATYYIAVYGEPTYSCSDVSFTAQATPVVSTSAVTVDATSGYKVSISQSSTVIYQLNNVNPSGEQYVHVTATGVTGGQVTVTLYTNTIGASCSDGNCTTDSSCYITVPCAKSNVYFAVVTAVVSGCDALTFTLTATATNFIGLTPSVTSFSITNNDMFYAAVSVTSPNSVVFHTELVSGPTMEITIWEDSCLSQKWARVDCIYGAQCNISIPTRAQHNGNSRWYITGQGAPGTNFKMWVTGGYGGNCAQPQFASGAFCSSIVNYNTWVYENITAKDEEAYNRYLWLTEHFTCGQTDACHQALQTFSCYESFPACDQQGFIVGSCISACTAVEQSCGEFCEYGLPQYSCLSDRYISSGFCTGTGPIVTTTSETTVSTAVITTGSSSSTTGSSSSSSSTTSDATVQVVSYATLVLLFSFLLA